jgi:hypothetical protein
MRNEEPVFRFCDWLLALLIGTAVLLAFLPPWCGLGWTSWYEWMCSGSAGLFIAMRFVWSR